MVSESLTFAGSWSYSLETVRTLVNKKKPVSSAWISFCEISGPSAACWGSANVHLPTSSGSSSQQGVLGASLPVWPRWRKCCLVPTPPCFGTSPGGAAASVWPQKWAPCSWGLHKKQKDSTSKAKARRHLLPSALMVDRVSCSLWFSFFFFFYKGIRDETQVKPFDRTILQSEVANDRLWLGTDSGGRLDFWNESQKCFHPLAHGLSYWKEITTTSTHFLGVHSYSGE